MAYSKLLFSGNLSELGNLPELICEIIQYFRNDFSTLYSCILVNRLWCRLAIPLLWEDPFSIYAQNFQFIEIYLGNLNEDAKRHLVDLDLIAKNCSSTLFNYPSFIKRFNTHEVVHSIKNWLSTLMDDMCWKISSLLVYRSLLKMFIENGGNLHSFEVEAHTINDCNYFKDTMELTLQDPNFTCNIRNLMFSMDFTVLDINMFLLLKFLCFNCNSISSFYIGYGYKEGNYTLVEKCLTQMINTQQNLKKISFESDNSLYDSFSLLTNISNTLRIITFYTIDFGKIIINIQEIFNQLNVLETIHIIYCSALNFDFVQQIINVNRPFKLKSLFLIHNLQVESVQLLIQKFGNDLENFEFAKCHFSGESKQKLFKSIIEYCTKIKYFSLRDININLALNLIENIKKQNLNYLNIKFDHCYDDYESKNLGQILPSKLEFLKLDVIKPSDLKIFLENSQDTFIKRLFIKIKVRYEYEDILSYIKKYIMKKKRVKYLAILFFHQELIYDKDLVSLEDEVKEFELYNIKVQKYDESYIDAIISWVK